MTPDEHLPADRHGRESPPRPPASDEPVMIGSELRDVEVGLRAALHDEADRITPGNRLDAILAAGQAESVSAARHRRWLLPVAAAAAAAVVVGGALVVGNRQGNAPPVVGGPTTRAAVDSASSGSTSPSTLPTSTGPSSVPTQTASSPVVVSRPTTAATTTSAAPTTTTNTTPPPAVTSASVPVYYVGDRQGNDVLFREFVRADVTNPVSPTTKVVAAVRTAMSSAPDGSGYRSRWAGIDLVGGEVTADGIRLELSRGLTGLSTANSAVAVQQLVWTATAAAAPGPLQVTFTLADGGDAVAPGQPTSGTYTRPTDAGEVYSLLSPLWIDSPARGQVIASGTAVTATGLASTNEANVVWQLLQSGRVVSKGAVTAATSAPARAKFTVPLGKLSPGGYVIRVYEESAKDGSVSAEQKRPFTVK
ncbi:MAG: Gmad2 immunoglobulin-like domain-containing protein [Humibacillus sp.]|nr:Gmad2 immunoglobulin-like domain-containing protein [Humibacillus sp.]MDN5778130.1 Gmad2 immunoglobulin-like domain-containing protein [Humibacillus sp.]